MGSLESHLAVVMVNVVALSLKIVILLLLPSVVQNIVAAVNARHVDQGTKDQADDEPGLNVVHAGHVVSYVSGVGEA